MIKRFFLASVLMMLFTHMAIGQNNIQFQVFDEETNTPLIGATAYVSDTKGGISDSQGYVNLTGLSGTQVEVRFSFVGYETQTNTYIFNEVGTETIKIIMESATEEHEEVAIVTATRSSRSIEEIPTRIEFLGTEELEEKAVMKSSNIAMLLRESTGIQMQITSPSSANQSIRIQGLDGRYTQLLKDGFPLYGGFSGGLSIMQIPPLDLKQVEVIKGSNATLYGGGAIAGLVNLVSIQPEDEARFRLMLDQTSAGGTTVNTFYAKRNDKFGMSLFASGGLQNAYDVNDDNFSDIPESKALTFNPTFFYYPSDGSKIRLALSGTFEDRLGGNLDAIDTEQSNANAYLQENTTNRLSYQLSYEKNWDASRSFTIKNSLLSFDRTIQEPNLVFNGQQYATFSEAAYSFGQDKSRWILGANLYSDNFTEDSGTNNNRNYEQITAGAFIQQVEQVSENFSVESGVRFDHNNDYGWFALPRVALFYNPASKFSYRLGGGLGYKTPTIFTEDTERLSFRGLDASNLTSLDAEKSFGGNFDINYKTSIGERWTFSINQLFFYTQLNDPLALRQVPLTNSFRFENAGDHMRSQGLETNLKLTYNDFKLFFNYALIDAQEKFDNRNDQKPLTAKHNIGAVLVYEEEGKWRIGLEAYYTGEQYRRDLTRTDNYWITGLMVLRKFKNISLYSNFENFSDTRQSKFENINLGSDMNPELLDIWAPLEGFVVNFGVIIDFGHSEHH
ncbi:TonB-dependent receptor [Roseivirga sp.]|uniref:TonB-dependent receptor n=1 Tax=Roseivirga sp. TaxID=1964215 RepID=UPI002B2792E0|nr:TonB-dependent receptor [Roseivirga sp.]